MSRKSTPKKSDDSLNCSGQFTSIALPESPAVAVNQRNLTGLPRVARDVAADIYNDIQKWNDLHIQGAAVIQNILKHKVPLLNSCEYTSELEDLCVSLLNIINDLDKISNKLQVYAVRMKSIAQLHKAKEPIFISWSAEMFGLEAQLIADSYTLEFQLKRTICECIAHSRNKEELMFQASSWVVQPYIDDSVKMSLESLLTETGHRNIMKI